MAEVHGKGGSITFTNLTAGVKTWSLDSGADVAEVTDFADAGVKAFIAGGSGWTASCTANWDAANTAAVGDSATLTLTVTSGTAYSGTAILTGMAIGEAHDGVVEVTYSFQGTGALTPPA